MKNLVIKNPVTITGFNMETGEVTLSANINGLIDAKEGKQTHVIVSDSIKLPRKDGKLVTVQLNGWYK